MSSGTCQHCGCSEIDVDPARGDAVCTNCGSVLEDNIIVSEVQFEEYSHGGSRAIGQLVTSEGQTPGLNIGFQYGTGKDSRVVTLQNARRKIVQISGQLRLNQHCVETAYNFYKLALNKRLTRGRKNSNVIAACIYMVCRTEATPHMLLDLSDVVQVNVYELGKTYLRLSNALCINIPSLDPCLYIVRFAHRLEFGDKTHEVSMTALRLVQRMKRDWMHTGRRPSGLCGAALLVAARLHDFSRTIKDVIKVVRVCEATLRKRLVEFSDTPSSRLTLDEFMNIDLEEEQDPPCFKEARRKQKLQQLEDEDGIDAVTEKINRLQKLIEKALDNKKKRINGPYSKYNQSTPQDDQNSLSENEITDQFIVEETIESISCFVKEDIISNDVIEKTDDSDNDYNRNVINSSIVSFRPTAASLGLKESIEDCMKKKEIQNKVTENEELDITGLDDEELDSYIMTEEEIMAKTELWMKINADYLREQKEREERKAKEEEENANKTETKKRKRQTKKRNNIQANNTREALEMIIQEKKLSRKINYEVLENLYTKDTKTNDVQEQTDETTVKPPKQKVKLSHPKGGEPSESIKGVMSSIFQQTRQRPSALPIDDDSPEEIDTNEMKYENLNGAPNAQETSENLTDLPDYKIDIPSDELAVEDEMEEMDDEDEEDEQHFSAAQLLGLGDAYGEYGEDEYYD